MNAAEVVSLTNTKLMAAEAYTVTFYSNGGSDVPIQAVPAGHTVTEPTPPTKAGKVFCGWYMDSGLLAPYDFTWAVMGNLNLYAKWADAISHNLSDATIQRIYRYTGSAVTPIVRDNAGQLLTAGTHYTVSYIGATQMREPGVYTLTVTGKGSYTGSQTASVRVLTFEQYDGTGLVTSTLPANNDHAVVVTGTLTAMASACWYVVSEDVTVADRIRVNGDVNLVLCDGATLTAENGISVTDGHSLTIYSQSGNTGALVATVPDIDGLHAAIGGDRYRNPITVFDPPVKAGTITIHGGVINATANGNAAGIGEGYEGGAGTITIYGGKITARCGTSGTSGTGIGGTGATVHLGWCRETDDFIDAQGFIGNVIFDKAFFLDGTGIQATVENCAGQKMVPATGTFYTVTFQTNGGSTVAEQVIMGGFPVAEPVKPMKVGYQFAGWYANEGCSGSAYDFTAAVTSSFTLYAKWEAVAPISYIDADGQTVTGFTDYAPMEDCYTELPAGTYFVGKNTTVSSRINLDGTVNLILGDGKTLTAEEGIQVAEHNTLNIFQQSEGTGALTASTHESHYAAIGANYIESVGYRIGGTICIYGGVITANGYGSSAAIGGTGNQVANGDIYIYGGTVTANTDVGVAIGCEKEGNCGTINILGGKIKVNGDILAVIYGAIGIGSPNGTIHLGWSRLDDDFIQSFSYRGTVIFDKSFVLGSNDGIEANSGNIAGEKLLPNDIPFYDVSFDTNGAGDIASQHIKGDGRPVVQPETPVKLGHAFEGWYTDEEFSGSPYEFTDGVTSDFTLYAKWWPIPYALNVPACFEATVGGSAATTATIGQEVTLRKIVGYRLTSALTVTDADNATLDISNAGNGCYTFTMPASDITATAEYTDMFDVAGGADGSADQPYVISSTDGWNYFCDLLAEYDKGVLTGKTVTLGGDIPTAEEKANGTNAVTRMAGSEGHDFTGIFDGGGNTLTVGYANTGNGARTAPFSYVDGATISNLVVGGSITGSAYRAAGVIGETGTTTSHITNCVSSLSISSDRYTGGFSIGGNVEIEGCVFNGTIKGSSMSGGFVGCSQSKLKIKNCLFAPQSGSSIVGGTFYYNGDAGTITNSYYTEALGDAQGKAARHIVAGENVTTCEVYPVGDATETYSVSGITAYAEGITCGDTFYYGGGDVVNMTLSHGECDGYNVTYVISVGTLSGTGNPYSFAMLDEDVTISVNKQPIDWATESSGDDWDHAFMIYNKDQLDMLAQRVNSGTGDDYAANGYEGKYFKLGANIAYSHKADNEEGADTENNYTAIGGFIGTNNGRYFRGHFDGQGHTVSGIRIYNASDNYQGIFGQTEGADIRGITLANARITGKSDIGGIVGANWQGTVSDCHVASNVAIHAVQTNTYRHGGIVGNNNIGTVSDCTSAATLTKNENCNYYGGIAGINMAGTLRHNFAIGAVVPAANNNYHGAICGRNSRKGDDKGTLENNYYYGCTVAETANATGVGCSNDNIGAVPAYLVTTGDGVTVLTTMADDLGFSYDSDGDGQTENYYRDGIELTLGSTRDGYTAIYIVNGVAISGSTFIVNADAQITATWTKNVLTLSDNADNASAIATAAGSGKVYEVTLSGRTLYKDGAWNTLCLPFSVVVEGSPLDGDGVDVRTLNTTSFDAAKGELTLNFTPEPGETGAVTTLQAGQPYIIKWNNTGEHLTENDLVFQNVTVSSTVANVSTTYVDFIGTYAKQEYTEENNSILFLGEGNTLYYPQPSGGTNPSIGAFRAYFQLNNGLTAGDITAARLFFGDGEETQGIKDATRLNDKGEMINDKWYNLDGVRLDGKPTKKGLYIHGGKKVVIK